LWKEHKRHGQGKLIFADGNIQEGNWIEDSLVIE